MPRATPLIVNAAIAVVACASCSSSTDGTEVVSSDPSVTEAPAVESTSSESDTTDLAGNDPVTSETVATTPAEGPPAEESSAEESSAEAPSAEAPLDTTALAARLADTIAGLDFEESSAVLDDCPSDQIYQLLLDLAPTSLLQRADLAVTPAEVAESASAYELPISGTALLGCSATSDENGIGIDIGPAPSSVESYLREFNDPTSRDDLVYDLAQVGTFAGGEFFHAGVETNDQETEFFFTSREVLWVNDDVMISAYTFGDVMTQVDLDAMQTVLADRLGDLVDAALI